MLGLEVEGGVVDGGFVLTQVPIWIENDYN